MLYFLRLNSKFKEHRWCCMISKIYRRATLSTANEWTTLISKTGELGGTGSKDNIHRATQITRWEI